VQITICGARGSTPAPGAAFLRYGGETSCVAIAHDGQDPSLVLDAGTGLRTLTAALDGRAFRGTILIGHLHWDHTHGLPFFRSGDREDASVRVMIPAQGDASATMALAMSPPHFPVRLEELQGAWSVEGLEPGTSEIEGFSVTALDIPHKNSRTFGFRITDGSTSVAYLSDHWPTQIGPGADGIGELHDAALALCEGVDVLLHDSQYKRDELKVRGDFGHACVEYAARLAEACKVKRLVLFHHDPERTDDEIDEILLDLRSASVVRIEAAAEGMTLTLP